MIVAIPKDNKELIKGELPQVIYLISGFVAGTFVPLSWFLVAVLVSFIFAVGMKVAIRDNIKIKMEFDNYMAQVQKKMDEVKKGKNFNEDFAEKIKEIEKEGQEISKKEKER